MITIDKLPPLLSVPVEDLKLFSKTQLRVYLEAYGVEPLGTKPKIKGQVRDLIRRLSKRNTDVKNTVGTASAAVNGTSASKVVARSDSNRTASRDTPVRLESASAVVPGILTSQTSEDTRMRTAVLGKRKHYDAVAAGTPEDLGAAKQAAADASTDLMHLLSRVFGNNTDDDIDLVDTTLFQTPSEQPRKRAKTLDEIGGKLEQLLSGNLCDTTPGGLEIMTPVVPVASAHDLHPDRKLYTAL